MDTDQKNLVLSGILLAVAIGAGAFGAHALQDVLSPDRLETWEIAVRYQVWNALGLISMIIISKVWGIDMKWPVILLYTGILIFSGSLYILCLSDIRWFGAITPIGGVALITGWILFAIRLFNQRDFNS